MRKVEELLKEKIPVGVLSNTHGLNGDLKLHTFTNLPEVIAKLVEVIAYNEAQKKFTYCKFEKIKKAHGYFIVHIAGVNTISEAEKLKGFVIYVDKSAFPKSKDGEYYFYELLNSEVYDENENYIGLVEDIVETGNNDVIVVKKNKSSKEEIMIPVIERYVLKIDKEGKKIQVKLPEWLE
ncbi:ribosome maturation factor RimM [Fervidobacterium gondwanense]|uniref:Ribosome maturation factor RimM n=1 Tax=Fervidobacterium gondwanense DSM 13020 TaxID=1121883 RepID=A0A1M7S6Y4_FERGO|nr:ribosome maturation factor RimM [Fervidobacterium gondwanense]SHN54158.1 16S rRNA processing protein RimM [Fervidobacterium gondwanense DSM 13020]